MAEVAALPLKETPLAGRHRALSARLVDFAGYSMPVQYPTGIVAEHRWTRINAGLFDVSHMGPAFLTLANRSGDADADHAGIAGLIERLICGDVQGLRPGHIRYTLLLNETGGVIDDLMIGRPADSEQSGDLYLVVNAATKDGDFALIGAAVGTRAVLRPVSAAALLALQGPEAADIMATLVPAATDLSFMTYGTFALDHTHVTISRSGYTGEDGFEILVAGEHAEAVWQRLLQDERVKPAGLGARDSLRLEAGLPLYGQDLDDTVSPVEAGLSFAVSKRRRAAADFPGAARILGELSGEPVRIRVGLLVEGAPARAGTDIVDDGDNVIGSVTSGGFSPTLSRPVAMGYLPPRSAEPGTKLGVVVRGRKQPATVTPLPFVSHRYVRKRAS